MSTGMKLNLALLFLAGFIWVGKNYFAPKKEEIVVANIRIDKKPCISAMNSIFGNSVDSSNLCDCLIPEFYNIIKGDSQLIEKFKSSGGFFKLEGALNDSAQNMFAGCVKKNLLDPNHIFYFAPETKLIFKEKFKKAFAAQPWAKEIDIDLASDCIVEKLNGNITITEYLADDYDTIPKIKKIMEECLGRSH